MHPLSCKDVSYVSKSQPRIKIWNSMASEITKGRFSLSDLPQVVFFLDVSSYSIFKSFSVF